MPKQTPAAAQFAALGIDPADFTKAMRLAVKQKWGDLPVEAKVADLRVQLADVSPQAVPQWHVVEADIRDREPDLPESEIIERVEGELARLKRNAGVDAWRRRSKIQAALDARDLKFAALRAKRGKVAPARAGTETGDPAPADTTSSGDRDQLAAHSIQTAARAS